jgi:repressor LexA
MTRSQYEVYIAIEDFIKEYGYSPSVRELCNITGKSSPGTIYVHLHKLKDLGYITFIDGKNRTIRIIKKYRCKYDKELFV